MVPVHEAAVPLELAVAVFTTFSCNVSELASPIGAELDSTVAVELVVVVWAAAQIALSAPAADRANTNRRKDIFTSVLVWRSRLHLVLRTETKTPTLPGRGDLNFLNRGLSRA